MAYAHLTPDNIFKRYSSAKTFTEELTRSFPEFQRIARNRPHPDIDPAYPKTTDGTAASIIQKTPKRVVQQLPTGVVESEDGEGWLPIVAQYIYVNKIIPHANEDYGLFEKSHLIIESGLALGSGCSLAPFLNHNGYLSPDVVLPYWGDIIIPKGKKSGNSLKYMFIRAWWQKDDIEALIADESDRAAKAKKRGDTYDATWDTAALKEVLEAKVSKDKQAVTPSEDERGSESDGIELITGFQVGVKGKFYTFNPETKKIVRTKTNKDPRGKMPIDWFYGDIDGTNPFGRSVIELIGGLQNLIDSGMQMYEYNRALMLNPPVIRYGNIGNFAWKVNAVIDATTDQDKVEVLDVDSSAIQRYSELYSLHKSQILNLVSSPDTSISSQVGNPGFSKTDAGVKQQTANISVDDNAVRKRFESWFESWSETAINLYFAERSGVEELQLDKETADKLRNLPATDEFDPRTFVSESDTILINYDTATTALKFRVDASTSKMQDNAAQLAAIETVSGLMNQSPALSEIMVQQYPDKILELWNRAIAAAGLEDPEKISIDLDEFKQKQAAAQEAANQQALAQSQAQQPQPASAPPQASVTTDHINELRQLGFNDSQIQQAIAIHNQQQGAVNA